MAFANVFRFIMDATKVASIMNLKILIQKHKRVNFSSNTLVVNTKLFFINRVLNTYGMYDWKVYILFSLLLIEWIIYKKGRAGSWQMI